MNSNNYIVIQGWMCNELKLAGNELLVFALIYGFSQDGTSKFSGSRNYIASTFNITLPTVDNALKKLLESEYITKEKPLDGINYPSYKVNFEGIKKFYTPYKEILYNNTNNKNNNTNSKELVQGFEFGKKKKAPAKNLYHKCIAMIDEFTEDRRLGDLLLIYLNMRLEMRDKPMYANQWKGMLNKLDSFSDSAYELCNIVQQSIDRGYLAFYPVNNYKQKSTHDAINESGSGVVEIDTKEDADKREQFRAKMEAEGKKTVF